MSKREYFKLISAVHLFFVKDGKVLLLRRANTGFQDGNYSVVAGHIDGQEKVTTATTREAKEEAGVSLKPEDLKVVHVMHRLSEGEERIDFFLEVHSWEGEVSNCEPDKCDDLSWFELSELPSNMVPYVRSAIENWQSQIYFSEFGWE